jgi:hypothetical protein
VFEREVPHRAKKQEFFLNFTHFFNGFKGDFFATHIEHSVDKQIPHVFDEVRVVVAKKTTFLRDPLDVK